MNGYPILVLALASMGLSLVAASRRWPGAFYVLLGLLYLVGRGLTYDPLMSTLAVFAVPTGILWALGREFWLISRRWQYILLTAVPVALAFLFLIAFLAQAVRPGLR